MQRGTPIGELLKMGRERSGMTQEELARRLHIDRTVVTKIETGTMKQPSYVLVKEWAQVTNSMDLIEMDMTGGQDAAKKLRQLEMIVKQAKSIFETVSFMRIKQGRGKKNAAST